jgi:hypothetical protein
MISDQTSEFRTTNCMAKDTQRKWRQKYYISKQMRVVPVSDWPYSALHHSCVVQRDINVLLWSALHAAVVDCVIVSL